jgi:hypothetical protein
MLSITLLNHACLLIDTPSGVRLLCDPWFDGTAFAGGWGLRYRNEQALDLAASATHLWISHFHEDHMHMPTLRELARRNPDIVFLANDSYNFQMQLVAQRLGFSTVQPVRERHELRLAEGCAVTRYPVTGIDNMLLLRDDNSGTPCSVLNYNDCNLSRVAQRLLARKIGPVDIFLGNFNHAGKLLHARKIADGDVKRRLIRGFAANHAEFDPVCVIPFASYHYYRAPESCGQNTAMIDVDDLVATDARVVGLHVGECFTYDAQRRAGTCARLATVTSNALEQTARTETASRESLIQAGVAYAEKLRRGFGPAARLFPSLFIAVPDLGETVRFKPGLGVAPASAKCAPDIECHSSMLHLWLTQPYGTDAFAVGAHFALRAVRKGRLVATIASGLLVENRLDLRSLLGMLVSRRGWAFLWNRREEILGILVSGKIYADYHND